MPAFSDSTRAMLREAGWSEDRQVDTRRVEGVLRGEGFPVHRAAVAFLERFDGLHITHPNHRAPGTTYRLSLGVDAFPPDVLEPDVMRAHVRRVGHPLCYIGEAGNGFLSLLMDPSGTVYVMNDDWLAWVGDSGCDAIEALCTGRELRDVPESP